VTKRTYENDSIRVFWNSTRCIHGGKCIRALPEVFNTSARPWINLDAANVDRVVEAIQLCPSGALAYERLDGGPKEIFPEIPVIIPRANGPLFVRGRVSVETASGQVFEEAGRMTLCRCGASQNQPFCDNSHRTIKFKDNPRVISPERQEAATPSDIANAEPDAG
jgi:uncharacterized Fe-S cluster protein YjdI/CDGSH-type Zn-finger protein